MRASLQQQISPYTPPSATQISAAEVSEQPEARDSTGPKDRTDFRTLITNSMEEVKAKREAKEKGDFSEIESEEEFLDRLAEETKPKREIRNTLNKDDFLKLFVEQLKHQDPLSPDDGAEMASKLAQFNSLEQMMNVNTNLEKMAQKQNVERSLQLVNYVGKEISLEGGRLKLENGKITDAQYELAAPASSVTLQVRDEQGFVVKEVDLGTVNKGAHAVNWDGLKKDGLKAADGIYSFSLRAKTVDGKDIPVQISTNARILGVDMKNGDSSFHTDFGKVKLEEIQSIGRPGFHQKSEAAEASKAATAAAAAKQESGGSPAKGESAKPQTPVADQLDRMKAEGNLDLAAGKTSPTKSDQAESPEQAFARRKAEREAKAAKPMPAAVKADDAAKPDSAPKAEASTKPADAPRPDATAAQSKSNEQALPTAEKPASDEPPTMAKAS